MNNSTVCIDVDAVLCKLKATCKRAILHCAIVRVDRLQKAKSALMEQLASVVYGAQSGIIEFFRTRSLVKSIKRKIAEIDDQIVHWVVTLCNRYVS